MSASGAKPMGPTLGVLVVTIALLAGSALGARYLLGQSARDQLQGALDRARPRLLSIRTTLVSHEGGPQVDAASLQQIRADALEAASLLGNPDPPGALPGLLANETGPLHDAARQIGQALLLLGQAAEQRAPPSVLLMHATEVTHLATAAERDVFRSHRLALGLPLAEMERDYQAAWLVAWSQDLRRVDASLDRLVQTWLDWQRAELPRLIHEDRWQHLDEKTAADLASVEALRAEFEALRAPRRAAEVSAQYGDALQDLENAYRRLRSYLLSKTGVPRDLRLSGESLSAYDTSKREALRRLEHLLLQRTG